jgi:hypothetical protein
MQWTFPVVISPHDARVMYVGSSVIFRSTDQGESYTAISPDLSRNDPRTLGPSGGPITKDQTGVETYGTVFTLAESPLARGTIWAATDDGLVHITRNGGTTWTNITPPLLRTREWARMSIIEASRFNAGTAYLAANRFQLDDFQPYLFKTTDFGATWTRIDGGDAAGGSARLTAANGGIPGDEFTRVIREDTERAGLLYAGTERGLYVSMDDGKTWTSLRRNLPPVPVHDIAVKDGDVIAGTHGRSFWVLDDVSALRQYTGAMASGGRFYQPRDAHRVEWAGGFLVQLLQGAGATSGPRPTGLNPASGVILQYQLASTNQRVTLEVRDSAGAVIRSFTSEQDSASLADSVQRSARIKTVTDSLVATGVAADSAKARAESMNPAPSFNPFDEDAPRRAPRPPRLPNRVGLNRFAWNMREPDAVGFDGLIMWAAGLTGPLVPPGRYTFAMKIGDQPVEVRTARILPDPRSTATQADYLAQSTMLRNINRRTSEANTAVTTIRGLRAQLMDRMKGLSSGDSAQIAAAAAPWLAQLSSVEDSVYQTKNRSGQDPLNYPIRLNNRIAALAGVVSSADARPTRQSQTVFTVLATQLDGEMARLRRELGAPLDALNALLQQKGKAPLRPGVAPPPPSRAEEEEDDDEAAEMNERGGRRKKW